jgi:hypothetical protein
MEHRTSTRLKAKQVSALPTSLHIVICIFRFHHFPSVVHPDKSSQKSELIEPVLQIPIMSTSANVGGWQQKILVGDHHCVARDGSLQWQFLYRPRSSLYSRME